MTPARAVFKTDEADITRIATQMGRGLAIINPASMSAAKTLSHVTGAPVALWRYMREARDELRRVAWPSRETTIRYTIVVVVASVAIGMATGGFDWVLSKILEQVI